MSTCYAGPSGVVLTPDELLILWADLQRIPTAQNKPIRDKLKQWLEAREENSGN